MPPFHSNQSKQILYILFQELTELISLKKSLQNHLGKQMTETERNGKTGKEKGKMQTEKILSEQLKMTHQFIKYQDMDMF